MKHYFCVGTIFRNESMGMKEWIEHYLFHGADHIYMINDRSEDNYIDILQPYLAAQKVTLFDCSHLPKFRGRQGMAYNLSFKPILSDMKWLAILDMDEYLYSPKHVNIKDILNRHEDCAKLIVNWCWFGSSGHVRQPRSVVAGFTRRAEYGQRVYGPNPADPRDDWQLIGTDGPKAIINTSFQVQQMGVHDHLSIGTSKNISYKANPIDPELLINHYAVQSREYWEKVKMPRGDADCWHSDDARNWRWFESLDVGDIEDSRLLEQNSTLLYGETDHVS